MAEHAADGGGRRGGRVPPTTGDPTASVAHPEPVDRVVTIPNALSVLRLLGVPVFLWLLLGPHADVPALILLAVAGFTDYLDGKIARWLNQTSRIGVLLDPAADRLYILATLIAFVIRDIIPWWLLVLLVGRDVILGVCVLVLRRHRYAPLPVHYLGKAATFNLLYAFPLLLLAEQGWGISTVARPLAWAFTVWGTAMYTWAGVLYVLQAVRLVAADRAEERAGAAG
jgi:cardiolipin synthase (CMP-forming)